MENKIHTLILNLTLIVLILLTVIFLLISTLQAHAAAGVIYVDQNATGGTHDGTSWATAFTNVHDALAVAVPGDEIWVAQGIYYPDIGGGQTNDDPEATFTLKPGVALYGGFAATETLRIQRDWEHNITVLSGDLMGNNITDTNGVVTRTYITAGSNAHHVISSTGEAVTATSRLDGFVVTAGGGNSAIGYGGGMVNQIGSSPTVANVIFSGNGALEGSGMYNDRSNPTLINVTFSHNSSNAVGGIMTNNYSDPTLVNVTFTYNAGAGMSNDHSSPTLINAIFAHNSNTGAGGGMRNNHSSPVLINVTFNGNFAVFGGGIVNSDSSNPTLVNCILWGNEALQGAEIQNDESSSPTIIYSIIRGGYSGAGNIDADPLFIAPNAGDYRLRTGSPAIDAGNTLSVTVTTDFDGNPRTIDGNDDSVATVDMGAHEFQPGSFTTYYVNQDATGGIHDGLSWTTAFTNIQDALVMTRPGDEIWVAQGIYYPDEGAKQPDNAPTATFQLRPGVALFGGFAATETLHTQRDWMRNLTILSGDLDNNDLSDANGIITDTRHITGSNAYHVVTGHTDALLDGVTITAGNAEGNAPDDSGGGMFNQDSNFSIRNVIFSGNAAQNNGGGMANTGYNTPALNYVTFNNNTAANNGGGMANTGYNTPALNYVTFNNNAAANNGGGISNDYSNPVLSNVAFNNNTAEYGGGMFSTYVSNPILLNVIFSGNAAQNSGGGMANTDYSGSEIYNTTFYGNQAINGGGIYNDQENQLLLANCILWGNKATNGPEIYNDNGRDPEVTYSDIQGGYPGTGNIDAEPLFAAPDAGDYRLNINSPVIDAGIIPLFIEIPTTDFRGQPRVVDGDDDTVAVVDMGAYEFQPGLDPGIIYVDHTAHAGTHDGLSWTTAFTNVQDALAAAQPGSEIWVAKGVYYPDEGSGQTNNVPTATFQLQSSVGLYGGFAGNETARDQRDWDLNTTVLSGDLDKNDIVTVNGIVTGADHITGSNAFHVVTSDGVTQTVALDGFTITAGNANGETPHNAGGGIFNHKSDLTIANVTFSGNIAAGSGGGIANISSSLAMSNALFDGNAAAGSGGGMANTSSTPSLTNVTFSNNTATNSGGGIYNDASAPTLANCILWNNHAPDAPEILNTANSTATITYSDAQGGYPGTGNIAADPVFGAPASGNYRLYAGSPAIDAGNNLSTTTSTDLRGKPRIVDGDNDAITTVDMGAYEAQPPTANAGHLQIVLMNTLVTLDGSASSNPENAPLTYYWAQTAGPTVSFTHDISVTTFIAPPLTSTVHIPLRLTFTLTVTNTDNLIARDETTVLIAEEIHYLYILPILTSP